MSLCSSWFRSELDGGCIWDTGRGCPSGGASSREHRPGSSDLPELQRPYLPYHEGGSGGETPHIRSVSLENGAIIGGRGYAPAIFGEL